MPRVAFVFDKTKQQAIEQTFPKLASSRYRVTSDQTEDYNCIAWAAGQTDVRWWPAPPLSGYYWPAGIPRVATLDVFRDAFTGLGYQPCNGASFELRHEKVAFYVGANGIPTHAARQCQNGRWTSKLGDEVDIEHDFDALAGHTPYGVITLIMKRPIKLNLVRITCWAFHHLKLKLFSLPFLRP